MQFLRLWVNTLWANRLWVNALWAIGIAAIGSDAAFGQQYLPPPAIPQAIQPGSSSAFAPGSFSGTSPSGIGPASGLPNGLTSKDYIRLMEQANESMAAQGKSAVQVSPQPPAVPAVAGPLGVGSGLIPEKAPEMVIGSGIGLEPDRMVSLQPAPPEVTSSGLTESLAEQGARRGVGNEVARWQGPRWLARYQSVWMRRSGDEGLTYSTGGELGAFGMDQAGEYTVGYFTNPIDCYEVSYLGSLNWERSRESSGPVDSYFGASDPKWLENFQNANLHEQWQRGEYRSIGLNKRWLTDDLANYHLGLKEIDYNEAYRLRSSGGTGVGEFGVRTNNMLLGCVAGMELWRPLSQRLVMGAGLEVGVYGNKARVGMDVQDGLGGSASGSGKEVSLAGSVTANLRAKYYLRERWALVGGYRWWTLTGLATVGDQPIPALSDRITTGVTSDDTVLFHGVDAGLEIRF